MNWFLNPSWINLKVKAKLEVTTRSVSHHLLCGANAILDEESNVLSQTIQTAIPKFAPVREMVEAM